MRSLRWTAASIAIVLCATLSAAGAVTLHLHGSPDPVDRGEEVWFEVRVANDGASAVSGATLRYPLPAGVDQLAAQVRVDGGGWSAYPATGLLSLGDLLPGRSILIEIRAVVERPAPGALVGSAEVIAAAGPLAAGSLRVNVRPSVDAGPDRTVALGGRIELNDAGVSDGGDELAAIRWDDGGAGGSFDDPSRRSTAYTAPNRSLLIELTLTVTDRDGATASDALRLRVNAYPDPVDAGADRSVDEGGAVALDDATASDRDGWIVSYQWDDGGGGGRFEPSSEILHPTYIAPRTDRCIDLEIRLTLTVVDDWGGTARDSLALRVRPLNAPPSVDAGGDTSARSGEDVELRGTVGDDGPVEVEWEQIAGPPAPIDDRRAMTTRFVAPVVSSPTPLQFRLIARDECGLEAFDEVTIDVEPAGSDPGPVDPPACASLFVSIEPNPVRARLGETISYRITVGNDGESELHSIRAEVEGLGSVSLRDGRLAPGGRAVGTIDEVVALDHLPGPIVRRATAEGTSAAGESVVAGAEGLVELAPIRSALDLAISAFDRRGLPLPPLTEVAVGDEVTFILTITNGSEAPVTDLAVWIDGVGALSLPVARLSPWSSLSATFPRGVDRSDDGRFETRATVSGLTPMEEPVTESASFVLLLSATSADLSLEKRVDRTEAAVGDLLTYRYAVRNIGGVSVTGLELRDDRIGRIPLPRATLAPGESIEVSASYRVSDADLPGPLTNVATVSGFGLSGAPIRAEGEATVRILDDAAAGGGGAADGIGRIVISEVAWAGTPSDPTAEWIELANTGAAPVDLAGWRLVWGSEDGGAAGQTVIELNGTIDPLPFRPRAGASHIAFVERSDRPGVWRVFDASWWAAGPAGRAGSGYYLLERGSDRTVANVVADLVYGAEGDAAYELPDGGATLSLIDPDGRIVDTVSVGSGSGWPGGDVRLGATMERTDLLGTGHAANWHTNAGVLTYGRDAAARRWRGTAGRPNAPSLEALLALARDEVPPGAAESSVVVPARSPRSAWVLVTPVAELAGGGGAVESGISTVREGAALRIDRADQADPGFVWIIDIEGEASLAPIGSTPR